MATYLGKDRGTDRDVFLPLRVLKKHFVALGNSGSGKTVLCKAILEDAALEGIPSIAIDPQGDIASLGLPAELWYDRELKKPLDVGGEKTQQFAGKVRVVVFTPASRKGVPICLNPLTFTLRELEHEDLVRTLEHISGALCQLLGYNLNKDAGKSAQSFIFLVLKRLWESDESIRDFKTLADTIVEPPPAIVDEGEGIISDRDRKNLARRVRLLGVGERELLFELGVPVDIDILLGRKFKDRTQISVIYLNTLPSIAEKRFFVSCLANALYHWMLKNPSRSLQALFYIDEVSPYLPPDPRKPLSKDVLRLLFKQARKYGVGCLMATQNPGDVDYKAFSQFGTWGLGRLTTKQDVAKVKIGLEGLGGDPQALIKKLPALKPPEFLLYAPDAFDDIVHLRVRPLYTKHITLSEGDVQRLTSNDIRRLFSKYSTIRKDAKLKLRVEKIKKNVIEEILKKSVRCFDVTELSEISGLSEPVVRRFLRKLVSMKKAKKEKVGKKFLYHWSDHGLVPKKGIREAVLVAPNRISAFEAKKIALADLQKDFLRRPKESITGIKEIHVPFWKTSVEVAFIKGVFFKKYLYYIKDFYVWGLGKAFAVIRNRKLVLQKKLDQNYMKIKGLDEFTAFSREAPSNISNPIYPELSEQDICRLIPLLIPTGNCRYLELCFIPFWRVQILHKEFMSHRTLWIDGITGNSFIFMDYSC